MKFNKLLLTVGLVLAGTLGASAQKTLTISNQTKPTDFYPCEDRKEMLVVFKAPKDLPSLEFNTQYNQSGTDILSIDIDSIGTEVIYKLVLPTESSRKGTQSLNRRRLSIYCDGFDTSVIEDCNASPKTKWTFEVTDPYAKIEKNPYYKSIQQANDLFQNGNYTDALSYYQYAQKTPEYNDEVNRAMVDGRIAAIDSIQMWRAQADEAKMLRQFPKAVELYNKIIGINASDVYAQDNRQACTTDHINDCQTWRANADDCLKNDHLVEARDYYKKIIDADCFSKPEAQEQILYIDKKISDRKNRSHFFNYEYQIGGGVTDGKGLDGNAPIGFSTGKCSPRGWSGYFSLHTNVKTFDLIRDKREWDDKPELDISFGWTHKIIDVAPVWIHFGPGYTGVAEFNAKEGHDKTEACSKETSDIKFYHAVAVEAGLTVKVWYVDLRYTFQYRFALSKEKSYEDCIGKTAMYVGVGFTW